MKAGRWHCAGHAHGRDSLAKDIKKYKIKYLSNFTFPSHTAESSMNYLTMTLSVTVCMISCEMNTVIITTSWEVTGKC